MKVSFTKKNQNFFLHQNKNFKTISSFVFCIVLLFFFSVNSFAQNNSIKGRVTTEAGEPLARASVIVKGTTRGVNTDDNGNFDINAPGNGSLIVSSVGFTTREVKIAGRNNITISMVSSGKQMEQVVVVGYGTQRRQDVTGSVASISSATLKEVPAPNVIDQLKGRTAGVDIVSNNTAPGASGQIRIRGNRTITNNQGSSDALDAPLIVIDGIPYTGSINDINPEDIANVDILKDASATAIYGSRGSGGVILITTKRGRIGKPVVTLDSYYGIANAIGEYKLFNGPEYAQFKADAATYNRTSPGTTAYPLTAAEQAALTSGISTDWQKLIYKQGFTTSNQIGVSGGNESTQYGMGLGYYNQTGIIPNQKFERYSIRTTIDQKIGRLKIGLNSINALEYTNNPGGNVAGGLARLTPLAAAYNADGTVNLFPQVGSIDAAAISPLTLITKKSSILARSRRISTINSVYAELQLAPGLRYKFIAGLSFRQDNGNGYNGPLTWTNTATTQATSNASVTNSDAWNYDLQNLLYYDKTFRKHKIGFTGLYEVIKDHSQSSGFNGTGVPADYILNSNLALATSFTAQNGGFTESGLLSYMARVNYSYDNRYLLTATVREDGSSILSPGHQYFTYPAVNAGWIISNERFMNGVSLVSNLKLRGGWGVSGNRNVSPYATLGLLGTGPNFTYNFGTSTGGQQQGVLVTSLPNPNLTWQSTSQWNAGIDFSILKNRFSGSLDIYQQNTKDILLPVNLPPSNGAGSTIENLGRTKGHGVEINLSSINVQTKSGFTWSTDFNFYCLPVRVVLK